MLNTTLILGKLRREIQQTQVFIKRFEVHEGHSLLDHTIVRYLWGAVATAQLVLIIAADHRSIGASPLVRQILETAFSLKYLLNTGNPDENAARTLVWDFLNANEQIGIEIPNIGTFQKVDFFDADEAIEAVCLDLQSFGENPDVLRHVYTEAKALKKRHWHWTGKGPGAMIRELMAENEPSAVLDKFETNVFRYSWAEFSMESHATARWHIPHITVSIGKRIDFEDPLAIDYQKAAALAGLTGCLLRQARYYPAKYYGIPGDE
jgi:hypothetical protein